MNAMTATRPMLWSAEETVTATGGQRGPGAVASTAADWPGAVASTAVDWPGAVASTAADWPGAVASTAVDWPGAVASTAVDWPGAVASTAVDWIATGVAIDSRTTEPGDLFVAIRGPSHDGHDFVAAARAAGAVAAVVSRIPANLPPDMPLVVVGDTFTALQDLAQVARHRGRTKIIAVTGSVGKTGTKEALHTILAAHGPTTASIGSLNNHWGVPLSLARLPETATYGVFELGMNHAGELGPLSRLVKPDIALITTIEAAHIANFASLDAIADAKAEIFDGMGPRGTAILNRDNPQYARLLAAARTQGIGSILSFGAHPEADARLLAVDLKATCSAVSAEIGGEAIDYCLSLPGQHWALNSLAVLLAVRAAGGSLATATRLMATLSPPKGRGTRQRVTLPEGSFTLIDDSYNANPASMAAAFTVLGRLEPGAGGRRVAILGDMRELGERADTYHAALAPALCAAGVDLVFTCGTHMHALSEQISPPQRGAHCSDSAELATHVAPAIRAGDVVLVKGSAGSRMGLVVNALIARNGTGSGTGNGSGTAGGSQV